MVLEKANEMKSYLAMKCRGCMPKNVQLNFLRKIHNEHESSKTSSISRIPFVAADSLYFKDFTKSLNSGYNPSKRTAFATTHLDGELANITLKIEKKLAKAKNLTLCVDGWASPLKHSIYTFVIMTPERKQYIYFLEDMLSFSHTANFNAKKMVKVLEKVGPKKFFAIITDVESVADKYSYILPIRCIAYKVAC
ncbi:hypothetical protein RhiirB3_456005 [Rhizophagus irregularis]|nr:hypothetical protein RhiirB3_456005 [Rhizophagus irregularis]